MDINKVHTGSSNRGVIVIAAISRDMHRTVIQTTYHNRKQGSDVE
jgi:hypothetical protein